MKTAVLVFLVVVFIITLSISSSFSQQKGTSDPEAQKLSLALANPVANLISVPFQNNTVWGIGPNNGSQNVMNIQPVIPIGIGQSEEILTEEIRHRDICSRSWDMHGNREPEFSEMLK